MGDQDATAFARTMRSTPVSLPNYPPVSRSPASWMRLTLFGLVSVGVCLVCALIWRGVVVGRAHAPLWIIAASGAVFGLAGLLMLQQGLAGLRVVRRAKRVGPRHPHEPWRADHDWSDLSSFGVPGRGLRSRDTGRWRTTAVGLLIVACMGLVAHWIARPAAQGGGGGGWIFLAMALITDMFVVVAALVTGRALAMRVRYGSPRMDMPAAPIHPGDRFDASVTLPRGMNGKNGKNGKNGVDTLTATLRFVVEHHGRRGSPGRRKKTVIECREMYSTSATVHPARTGRRAQVAVSFEIPAGAPENRLRDRPPSFWDLEVRADTPGVDFVHRFAVPVYRAPSGG